MSFDPEGISRAVERRGPVCRVLVVEARGSTPRGAGTSMLVWDGGQSGTIGGGALEHDAARIARESLAAGAAPRLETKPLGPDLGQCCGGSVKLLWEVFDAERIALSREAGDVYARPADGGAGAAPPADLAQRAARPGSGGVALGGGWIAERIAAQGAPVWIYGAGHVGRALAGVLAPLPEFAVTLVDVSPDRLPDPMPEGAAPLVAADPVRVAGLAPEGTRHIVMTFSHAIDLELCDALLRAGARSIGLIGSRTKRARFAKRLLEGGHAEEAVAAIACPIGDPGLGKHPQQIAIGVAAELIRGLDGSSATKREAVP